MTTNAPSGAVSPPWRAFAIVGFAGAAAWALNFLTFAILARSLGPERFGLLNFGMAVAAALGAFLAPNLNVWGARLIAADPQMVSRVVVLVNGVQTAGAIVLFLVLLLAYPLFLTPELALQLVACNAMFFSASLGLQWVAQGLQRLDLIAWNQIIAACVGLLLTLVLVQGSLGQYRAPLALAIGQVLASGFVLWRLWRTKAFAPREIAWRKEFGRLRHAVVFGYFSILGMANQYAGVIFIKLFGDSQDVAFYGVASRTYLTFILVTAMLSTVFFPRVARLPADDVEGAGREIATWITLALTIGCGPAALMVGDPSSVIHVLFGDDYAGASLAVRAAGVAILFAFANNAYSMSLLARGEDAAFMRSLVASVFVATALGAVAAKAFGLTGISIVLALIDLVMLAALAGPFKRKFGRLYASAWIAPLAAMAVTILFLNLSLLRDYPIVRLMIGSVIYLISAAPWKQLVSWSRRS